MLLSTMVELRCCAKVDLGMSRLPKGLTRSLSSIRPDFFFERMIWSARRLTSHRGWPAKNTLVTHKQGALIGRQENPGGDASGTGDRITAPYKESWPSIEGDLPSFLNSTS